MDNLKVTIGLTLASAAVVGFVFTFIGSKLGKLTAGWAVMLATAGTAYFACRPLAGAFPGWPASDAVYRGAWAGIVLAIVAILFSSARFPFWSRALLTLLASAGLLFWIFQLYPVPGDISSRTFLLDWVGIPSVIILALWCVIEWMAVRSDGVVTPLVVGFVYAGIGVLNLMSSSTRSGNLIGAIGSVVGGSLVACFVSRKKVTFARGPVFVWLVLIGVLYVPSCYDADAVPARSLALIVGAPLLALLMEIPFFRRWKSWKRETVRAILLAIPIGTGVFLGYEQMKASGDGDVIRYPASTAPMCPSQIPIPNTINPPTMT